MPRPSSLTPPASAEASAIADGDRISVDQLPAATRPTGQSALLREYWCGRCQVRCRSERRPFAVDLMRFGVGSEASILASVASSAPSPASPAAASASRRSDRAASIIAWSDPHPGPRAVASSSVQYCEMPPPSHSRGRRPQVIPEKPARRSRAASHGNPGCLVPLVPVCDDAPRSIIAYGSITLSPRRRLRRDICALFRSHEHPRPDEASRHRDRGSHGREPRHRT